MQNRKTLQQPLQGELAMSRKKEEEKKMPFIVSTYVYAYSRRAAHALRSDQNMKRWVFNEHPLIYSPRVL